MSFSRRLRKLLRAQVGDWLHDDRPDVGPADVDPADPDGYDVRPDAEEAAAPKGPDGRPVPPDVAQAYQALEVPVGSDRATVKKGYRRVMKKYHQDRFANDPDKRDVAGEVSKRLNDACERVLAHLDRVA
jgi:DnaJ-domain-containing protein 1